MQDGHLSLRTPTHSQARIDVGQDAEKHPALSGRLVNTPILLCPRKVCELS